MSKVIEKKVLHKYFEAILRGEKTFEIRLANWDCEGGDILVLHELDDQSKEPTGRTIRRRVGSVVKTKDLDFWPQADIDQYGYQVIALLDEGTA